MTDENTYAYNVSELMLRIGETHKLLIQAKISAEAARQAYIQSCDVVDKVGLDLKKIELLLIQSIKHEMGGE